MSFARRSCFKPAIFVFCCLSFILLSLVIPKRVQAATYATSLTSTQQCDNSGSVKVKFTWTKAQCYQNNCTSYPLVSQYLDYSVYNTFGSGTFTGVDVTSVSSKTISGFASGVTYYWRINTDYGGYLGGWSPSSIKSFNFTTMPCLTPTPTRPVITATVSGLNVNFSWTAQSSAGEIVFWPASSALACINVNSTDAIHSPLISAGISTYRWPGNFPKNGTFVATFATPAGMVGCTSPFTVQTPTVTLNSDISVPDQVTFNWANPVGVDDFSLVIWDIDDNPDNYCQKLNDNSWADSIHQAKSPLTWSWKGGGHFAARLATLSDQPWVSQCKSFTVSSTATTATNLRIDSQVCQLDNTVQVHYKWNPPFTAGHKTLNQWIIVNPNSDWNNATGRLTASLGVNDAEYTTGTYSSTGGIIPNLKRSTPYYWEIVTQLDDGGPQYIAIYKSDKTYTSVSCQAVLWVDSSSYPTAYFNWTDPVEAGLNIPYYLGVWNTTNNPNGGCNTTDPMVQGYPGPYYAPGATNYAFRTQFPDGNYKAQLYSYGRIGANGVSECFPFTVKAQQHNFPSGWPTDKGYISYGPGADGTSAGGLHGPVIDIITDKNAPVKATMDGKVLVAGPYTSASGYSVIIQNSTDHDFAYTIRYSHLQEGSLRVAEGDDVSFGQIIANADCSGYLVGVDCANTSILHYLFDGFEMAPPYIPVTVPYACKSQAGCNTSW